MWYWICSGEYKDCGVFSVAYCVKNPITAALKLRKLQREKPEEEHWIRKHKEHSDPDYKQYRCPECGNLMSDRELSSSWDWAGPHCNKCGCTGMKMFSSVTLRPITTGYQSIMGKYRKILGTKTMKEIEGKK